MCIPVVYYKISFVICISYHFNLYEQILWCKLHEKPTTILYFYKYTMVRKITIEFFKITIYYNHDQQRQQRFMTNNNVILRNFNNSKF